MNENQQFLLYTAPDGAVKVEVYFKDETVWLTQKALADGECEVFRGRQDRDYISDFDREIKRMEGNA